MLGAARLAQASRVNGPTYAAFQAHIATLATGGVLGWTGSISPEPAVHRVTAGSSSVGSLSGSSWGNYVSVGGSNPAGCFQHGLPSQAEFNLQCSAGREMLIRFANPLDPHNVPAVTRNGLASSADEGGATIQVTEIIYWDGQGAQRMQPSGTLGPTAYTF